MSHHPNTIDNSLMHWTKVDHHCLTYRPWWGTGHLSASLNQSWFRAMKEAVSGSLEGALPPKLSIPIVNKQRICFLDKFTWISAACKTKQCNRVGLRDLWWLRDCSAPLSPSNADDRSVVPLTCVSIYLFHLNFCKFLNVSAISQQNKETQRREPNDVKGDAKMKQLRNWHKPGEIHSKTVIQNVILKRVTNIPRPLLKEV